MMRRRPTEEELLVKMAGLCSRSEQCEGDILTKLLRAGLTRGAAGDVINELKERGFIDEGRYARAFARDKVRLAGWGRRKIRMALAAKRVDSTAIAGALAEIDPEEYLRAATAVAEAKARSLDLRQREDVAKLYRSLAARGYEGDTVAAAVRALRRKGGG